MAKILKKVGRDTVTGLPVDVDIAVADTSDGHEAEVIAAEISKPAAFDISWAAAGTTNAPATTDYWVGAVGINNDGATGANVYHVVEISGTLTWVDTGATSINLYGG